MRVVVLGVHEAETVLLVERYGIQVGIKKYAFTIRRRRNVAFLPKLTNLRSLMTEENVSLRPFQYVKVSRSYRPKQDFQVQM